MQPLNWQAWPTLFKRQQVDSRHRQKQEPGSNPGLKTTPNILLHNPNNNYLWKKANGDWSFSSNQHRLQPCLFMNVSQESWRCPMRKKGIQSIYHYWLDWKFSTKIISALFNIILCTI